MKDSILTPKDSFEMLKLVKGLRRRRVLSILGRPEDLLSARLDSKLNLHCTGFRYYIDGGIEGVFFPFAQRSCNYRFDSSCRRVFWLMDIILHFV